jgi:hypothetical protein
MESVDWNEFRDFQELPEFAETGYPNTPLTLFIAGQGVEQQVVNNIR